MSTSRTSLTSAAVATAVLAASLTVGGRWLLQRGVGASPDAVDMSVAVLQSPDYEPRYNDAQAVAGPEPEGRWNGHGWLFVADEVGRGISIHDVATQRPVGFVYSPDSAVPHHPYISPDQRWVITGARFGSQSIVIDTEDDFATTFLNWPDGADGGVAGPLHGIYTWGGDRFLTALQRSGRVGVVSLRGARPEIEAVLDVGERPRDIMVTPDDRRAFVTMQREATVAVIDLDTLEVRHVERSAADYSEGTGGGGGMSADGSLVAVANTPEDEVVVIDVATERVVHRIPGVPGPVNVEFLGRTHVVGTGNRADGSATFIDADRGELLRTVRTGGGANIPSLGPDGNIWVTHNGDQHVAVLDPETFDVVAEVGTGINPHWIYFTPAGGRAFVSNWGESTISVVDVQARREVARIPTGLNPNGMTMKTDLSARDARAAVVRGERERVAEKIALAAEMVLPEPRDDREALFLNTCTQCHDLGRIVRNNAKGEQWVDIVQRMRGNGAKMDDDQMAAIIAYLQEGRQSDLEFGTRYDEVHGDEGG